VYIFPVQIFPAYSFKIIIARAIIITLFLLIILLFLYVYIEGRRLIVFGQIAARNGAHIAISPGPVMRRHNFNTTLITNILYMLMEEGIDGSLTVSFPGISIDLVRNKKVIEAGLKNKWSGVF
jgi:hypothetical protein